jgi:hypothetical protein
MMKRAITMPLLMLVLTLVAVPAFAQAPESVPEALWEVINGREGLSIYDEDAVAANLSGTSVSKPASVPMQLWLDINSRDGFSIYSAETLRARAAAANNGHAAVPANLQNIVYGREGFNVYDSGEQLAASLDERAERPQSISEDLWQIINGREGFAPYNQCAVC